MKDVEEFRKKNPHVDDAEAIVQGHIQELCQQRDEARNLAKKLAMRMLKFGICVEASILSKLEQF
jgi:hypothetical protein